MKRLLWPLAAAVLVATGLAASAPFGRSAPPCHSNSPHKVCGPTTTTTAPSTTTATTATTPPPTTTTQTTTTTTTATTATTTSPSPSASGCTIYTSPSGGGNGASASSPTSLRNAYAATVPGSVVCLEAGTYMMSSPLYLDHGGDATGWVTYRSYGGQALIQAASNFGPASGMFETNKGASWIKVEGLTFDGGNVSNAASAFHGLKGSHHLVLLDNVVYHTGSAGFAFTSDDYVTAAGNLIWRFGDETGWSSGISYNNGGGVFLYDNGPGFHNVFADNVIAGGADASTYDTDGNGIILDLAGAAGATLVSNNLIYMHQGRCVEAYQTSLHAYVVNNTCYRDDLDAKTGRGEIVANAATNEVWANNIAYASPGQYAYQAMGGSTVTANRNLQYGGSGSQGVAAAVTGDPLFASPPQVPSSQGWLAAPDPATIGTAFTLQAGSPAIDVGVDPRTLPGLDQTMVQQIDSYVLIDLAGKSRDPSSIDLGAYER